MIDQLRSAIRLILLGIAVCSAGAAGCGMITEADPADDPSPDYQDLDAGDGWGPGGDTDSDSGSEPQDTEDPDPADGGDGGDDTEDDGGCLDIAWEIYQVSGTCPGLPATGSIAQDGCAIEVPGELGASIGEAGSVDGSLVTTERCSGVAAILVAPEVNLVCIIDEVSCEAKLSGSASNSR